MSQSTMLQLHELADQMVAILTRWEPEGMMEVLEAYRHWPDTLHRLEQAWALLHQRAQEGYPLHPVVVELIEAVSRHQRLTAQHAEEIAPTAAALHRREIEALSDGRNAMWDHRANREHATPPATARPVPASDGGA